MYYTFFPSSRHLLNLKFGLRSRDNSLCVLASHLEKISVSLAHNERLNSSSKGGKGIISGAEIGITSSAEGQETNASSEINP